MPMKLMVRASPLRGWTAGGIAWYWHRVVPLLEASGHDAVGVDLPGDDYLTPGQPECPCLIGPAEPRASESITPPLLLRYTKGEVAEGQVADGHRFLLET